MAPTLFATATPTGSRASAAPVRLRGVSRSFPTKTGPHQVLTGIDLDIVPGEIVALIGASGSGKSTLLRQMCGLDTPDSGEILIGSRPVRQVDQRCAMAFQEPRLLPWRSLAENVTLGLPPGTSAAAGAERVAELLRLVGLAESADRLPRQVSGGMAQRASLARALARNPQVLLLDEPFGALDALTRLRMQDLLLDVHTAEPTTVVLVTHDVDEALYLADRVALVGTAGPSRGADIRSLTTVPGSRPRDRGDAQFAALKVRLLEGLGVHAHHRG
ncbi:ABC transporter ATP-binding protein [Ornithinimicrobium avium]|uniref:ABC transporter ATP-binding protein n=1 Tax=Ornithinimicrobium avium TaxID=2283195 RepID=A0A345NKD5_9MICO|nr:ABC transporter ATP-binding protein [Ornithinimicrobium avium]AXH95493.1 ABC transporter ATP-binding protein [Ornithinimicrobium avium]